MKVSENWLREWVSPDMDARQLADMLTMAGLEVDSLETQKPVSKKIVVGKIEKINPHPNADRLSVCQVNVGRKNQLQIVCGAKNARAGIKVPTALVGARLSVDLEIRKTKLRDIESSGMLCSGKELGLEETSEGLLILDSDAIPGNSINEYLDLKDSIIEIDLTPNRGDCLSIAGIAREVSALSGARFKPLKIKSVTTKSKRKINVSLKAKNECPHYVGRIIENIDPKATTPLWMKEKLRRSGLRSHSPVVDVTNYVLLELGQPMHAFDLDKLDGGIKVVKAKAKQKLVLLDGATVMVEPGTLMIADNKKPLALAGIMGGEASAVTDNTKNIFLESAYFAPEAIAGRARSMGLHTDSSHRFERGVDPTLQKKAIDRATGLLLDIVGGYPGSLIEKKSAAHLPKRKSILLRHARMERLLGLKISKQRVQTLLKRLGMTVTTNAKGFRVTPPAYRFDIEREVDLIEEVVRVHGYHHVPERAPRITIEGADISETRVSDSRIRHAMVAREYQEVITYSFIDPELSKLIDPETKPVALANPISSDMAVMRTSLWPGLLQTVQYNQNRQQNRMRLFEMGHCFIPAGKKVNEIRKIGGAATGFALKEQWGLPSRDVDFFDIKGDVEAITGLAGSEPHLQFAPIQAPALHPGQAAEITKNGTPIGIIGRLHPKIQSELGLDQPVILFELAISGFQADKIPEFRQISRFPAIRRDLAIVVDIPVPAAKIEQVAKDAAGELLVKLELFDDYRGEGVDSGRKSLALGLILQDSSRTLKEVEVEKIMGHVMTALNKKLGAEIRK